MSQEATIDVVDDQRVRCKGSWTLYRLAGLERRIATLPWPKVSELVWELSGVEAIDTSGAWLLRRTLSELEQKGQREDSG